MAELSDLVLDRKAWREIKEAEDISPLLDRFFPSDNTTQGLENIYRFIEFEVEGQYFAPKIKVSDLLHKELYKALSYDHINLPRRIGRRVVGVDPHSFTKFSELMFVKIPEYLEQKIQDVHKEVELPEKLQPLNTADREQLMRLQQFIKRYDERKVSDEQLISALYPAEKEKELKEREKTLIAHALFHRNNYSDNLRAAYLLFRHIMDLHKVEFAEFIDYDSIYAVPASMLHLVGLERKKGVVDQARIRFFCEIPLWVQGRIPRQPDYLPAEQQDLDWILEHFSDLVRNYGMLTKEKAHCLDKLEQGAFKSYVEKIFFGSFYGLTNSQLEQRCIQNARDWRSFVSRRRVIKKFLKHDYIPEIIYQFFGVPIGDFKMLNEKIDGEYEQKEFCVFLDKCVIDRHIEYEEFNKRDRAVNRRCKEIIDLILSGHINAVISDGCVDAATTHYIRGYLDQKAESEVITPEEAERKYGDEAAIKARRWGKEFFYGFNSPWIIITLNPEEHRSSYVKGRLVKSEDDLIFACFKKSNATMLITDDKHFTKGPPEVRGYVKSAHEFLKWYHEEIAKQR